MTDRKLTCVACKSAITEGDIAHSDLEFGGELKATNQPEYTADADTDLVATVGTLDEYTPMVRTTGAQTVGGAKTFTEDITVTNDKSYKRKTTFDWPNNPASNQAKAYNEITDANDTRVYAEQLFSGSDGTRNKEFILYDQTGKNIRLIFGFSSSGKGGLYFRDTSGTTHVIYQET